MYCTYGSFLCHKSLQPKDTFYIYICDVQKMIQAKKMRSTESSRMVMIDDMIPPYHHRIHSELSTNHAYPLVPY